MKAFKLQAVKLTNSQIELNGNKDFTFNYRKELLQIVEISAEGLTVSQMTSALAVQKALTNVSDDGTVYLENADHEWLKGRMQGNKWRFIAPEIVEFHNTVCDAKEADTPHLKDKSQKTEKAKSADA